MLLKTLIMASLLFIFYQDLRYRAVYWLVFPVLAVLLVLFASGEAGGTVLMTNTLYNLSSLLLQFAVLTGYFSVKRRKLVNITQGLLGWGDVLMLVCLAFCFSPVNYLIFYTGSLLVTLLVTLLLMLKHRDAGKKIPLAGVQALLFAVVLAADGGSASFRVSSDDWLLNTFLL